MIGNIMIDDTDALQRHIQNLTKCLVVLRTMLLQSVHFFTLWVIESKCIGALGLAVLNM